jgi:hypothetical protein
MRLEKITARPHPLGNRISLGWINPHPDQYPGVRIIRREGTHPISPTDGVSLGERNALLFTLSLSFINDLNLQTLSQTLRQEFLNNQVSLSESAASIVDLAGRKWQITDKEHAYIIQKNNGGLDVFDEGPSSIVDLNLKAETVYYYTLFLFKSDPREYDYDPHNRISAMASSPYDLAGQMMALLPAIYHRYDTALPKPPFPDGMSEQDRQRGQLRRFLDLPGSHLDQVYSFAKATLNLYDIDRTDGIVLPLLAQWIGWDTDFTLGIAGQRNEIRSAPAWYETVGIIPTAEATIKRISGWESRTKEFVHNVFLSNSPERMNLWERERNSNGDWTAPTSPLSLNFAYEGRPAAVRDAEGTLWLFYHTLRNRGWNIWFKTYREDREPRWAPSQPLTNAVQLDKHPASVVQGTKLWVFWEAYDEVSRESHINYRILTGGTWSTTELSEPFTDTNNERVKPCAVADNEDGVWLFWMEKVGARWQLQYNWHDGAAWGSVANFPLDGVDDPRIQGDPFVLFHSTDATHRVWVFWARKEPSSDPHLTRWQIAYRVKRDIVPNTTADWSEIYLLPKATLDHDDLEPAAVITSAGNIELFWSSNQGGSWSIWRSTLEVTTNLWGSAEQITSNPYSHRDPLPLAIHDATMLVYRSNESLVRTSSVYRATETVDFRYAGSTTVDTRNAAKIALRDAFEDFQTYTYDTQKTSNDWYARDTVGAFLTPNTEDDLAIVRRRNIIAGVLRKFLPIQVRGVFLLREVHYELVYTYDDPEVEPQHRVSEQMIDTILSEVHRGLADSYLDRAGFRWLRTWEAGQSESVLPDLSATPPNLTFRLFLKGVAEGA